MQLNEELQAVLDGKKGETQKKVLYTMMRYGELFGADAMVPVTSRYNHLVTSFGLKALTPVYDLLDQLIRESAFQNRNFPLTPGPWIPMCPVRFCRTWCSAISCTPARSSMKNSLGNWD